MLIELIILLIIGIAFLVIGWLIWKKEKITLIHEYHWDTYPCGRGIAEITV